MLYIGLTGGIAAGKTLATGFYRMKGAIVIDSDQLAREVVDPAFPDGKKVCLLLARQFGDAVIGFDGTLDRAELAKKVFGRGIRKIRARKKLASIMHPRIRAKAASIMAGVDDNAIVVHDIPLLAEMFKAGTYSRDDFDLIVVVTAGRKQRVRRMTENRGMSVQAAEARIRNQASDRRRRKIADVIIHNDRSVEETCRQLEESWQDFTGRNAMKSCHGGVKKPYDL